MIAKCPYPKIQNGHCAVSGEELGDRDELSAGFILLSVMSYYRNTSDVGGGLVIYIHIIQIR